MTDLVILIRKVKTLIKRSISLQEINSQPIAGFINEMLSIPMQVSMRFLLTNEASMMKIKTESILYDRSMKSLLPDSNMKTSRVIKEITLTITISFLWIR